LEAQIYCHQNNKAAAESYENIIKDPIPGKIQYYKHKPFTVGDFRFPHFI
jgi:hypothetical protein